MAAIVRHGAFKTRQLIPQKHVLGCGYATKAEKKKGIDRKVAPKIEWTAQSLASKGFLRSQKEYTPPSDLDNKLSTILKSVLGNAEPTITLDTLEKKFKVLNACFQEFQHAVPNSLLHSIETVKDIQQFYSSQVSMKTPLDKLKDIDLPPNLHVQHEYVRFNPETDTKFNGMTAFPKSSTLVTGLKYKDKYKGHTQAVHWPYN